MNAEGFAKDAKIPFDKSFWHEQLLVNKGENKDQKISTELLISDWQKKLDEAQMDWELNQLAQLRLKFLAQIEEWLNNLSLLQQSLDGLGLDAGIWLDLSSGELKPSDLEQMKRWATYLSQDKGAKAICELLGKAKQVAKSEKLEVIKKSIDIKIPYSDSSSKEEIIGLKFGRDIEQILPSELALLSDPDTEVLFDLKFIESRLLCFDMQGTAYYDEEKEIEETISELEEDKLGPMILCVDTSGSMQGHPEHLAKAMALYLATQAKSENRDCYLINFSTSIESYEFTAKSGLSKLIKFLQQSFHGGTDVAPALRHALSMMQDESYKKADVLIISDFIMGNLPSDILKDIEEQRVTDNKFNSLVIGNCFMSKNMRTHFDHEWIYNPHTSNIQELIKFKDSISR